MAVEEKPFQARGFVFPVLDELFCSAVYDGVFPGRRKQGMGWEFLDRSVYVVCDFPFFNWISLLQVQMENQKYGAGCGVIQIRILINKNMPC